VFLIDEQGVVLGEMAISKALVHAENAGLDLVQVAEEEGIPRCRLMNYADLMKEVGIAHQEKLDAFNLRQLALKQVKELIFSDTIAEHDVQVKVARLRKWLSHPTRYEKVKVVVSFKQGHTVDVELATAILENISSRVKDLGHMLPNHSVSRHAQGVSVSTYVVKYTPAEKEQYEASQLAQQEQDEQKAKLKEEAETKGTAALKNAEDDGTVSS